MIETQLRSLHDNVRSFSGAVASLDAGAFLSTLGRWTPRDIVAHLIGWNRYVIRGSRLILDAELPFYDVDSGEDYANVNAELIRMYPSRDKEAMLRELSASAEELEAFLRTLDEASWQHDYGVRHRGETITVRGTVDDLITDYEHHRKQLVALTR